jgi:crotonobetainyl-CoA:carnitine CoA-transferase CaiB-like acyl-CoA transferase
MVALRERDRSGLGQVIDVNLLESMLQMMSALPSASAHLDYEQPRLGSGIPYSVPRGTYQCADGQWVGISASSDSVAQRVLDVLGVAGDTRFTTFTGRSANRDQLEALMHEWCARHTRSEAITAFEEAHAAIGPVLTMADISDDPHYAAREAIVDVGGVPMQGLVAKLSATPGVLRWPGRAPDADGAAIREHGWGTPAHTDADESGDDAPSE